jgi:hypothetical protein
MGADVRDMCVRTTHRKSDRLWATVRVCERTNRRGGHRVSVLTPAGPGAEPGRAKHLVQARLERRVRLEVVRPRRHGLEGAAHCIRGGTRVRGDEGVDLAFSFVFI